MAQPDLFVVCKKCGSEVSPYITECPYCGNRLRKRAPKIERSGTLEPRIKGERRPRAPRLGRLRAGEIPGVRVEAPARPWATGLLVTLSLAGYILQVVLDPARFVVDGPIAGEWWRVATSPFVYANVWYALGAITTIAIFAYLLERRHNALVVLALFALGGAGGAAVEAALDTNPVALGGNGAALALAAAWLVPDLLRRRRGEEPEGDLVGVGVLVALMLAMPAATFEASWVAGLTGLAAGVLSGLVLSRVHSSR